MRGRFQRPETNPDHTRRIIFTGPRQTIFLHCPSLNLGQIWCNQNPNPSTRIRILDSATDSEFDFPNFEFELQIPFSGYNSDAKSNLFHITNPCPIKSIAKIVNTG